MVLQQSTFFGILVLKSKNAMPKISRVFARFVVFVGVQDINEFRMVSP